MKRILISAMVLQLGSASFAAEVCPLKSKFSQPVKNGSKTVRYDSSAVVFKASFRVDTDGNVRSYSAVDPRGDRCGTPAFKDKDAFASGCAMDSLCNGLKMFGPPKHGQPTHYGSKECAALLTLFKRYREANYALTDGTRIDPDGSIAVHTDGPLKGKPCETPEGFLVSMTSAASGLPTGDCKQDQYLDSAVPYMVVPKCWSASYRQAKAEHEEECKKELPAAAVIDIVPGDLVAMRKSGTAGDPHFAIVGDLGPNRKLGEASIGFHMAAAGAKTLPRTVAESDAYDDDTEFDVAVFRRSATSGQLITPETFQKSEKAAKTAFDDWKLQGMRGPEILSACAGK